MSGSNDAQGESQARLVPAGTGSRWLVIGPAQEVPRIAVLGEDERDALARYADARARWSLLMAQLPSE
jgi:hypothetical protein